MRFDDTLVTVLAAATDSPAARGAAWRQLVDLVGRGRAAADAAIIATLAAYRDAVPLAIRAASARALAGAQPPLALVRLLALDDIAVAAPLLRHAALDAADWRALLPQLSPQARAVLRHRRDLPADVVRALAAFGAVDFVLGSAAAAPSVEASPTIDAASPAVAQPEAGPFLSLGAIAKGLPLVAEALRRGNDNEAPSAAADGTFRIADVVARIEAFRRRREEDAVSPSNADHVGSAAAKGFRFETDADGRIRWADAEPRGALIGASIARAAAPGRAGADGVAAGSFRRRARIAGGRLLIDGADVAVSGIWMIFATPSFDRASGRFAGYRGSARRPFPHEGLPTSAAPRADSLRQLVHELRTPTNAIAGFSEMIEREMLGPVAPVHREQAAAIRQDAGGLLAAIDDLDTAARIEAGALELRPAAVPLGLVLSQIAEDLAPLAETCGARFLIVGDAVAVADPRAVERLLSRLSAAMLGAAGPGEEVAVRIEDGGANEVAVTIERPAALAGYRGDAVLSIDDEAGPASLLGIGFALRLVRNLARELGGAVLFGERQIEVRLPAAEPAAAEQARTR